MDKLFITLQHILPQHALSRLVGWLAEAEWLWLKNALISLFISQYDVNMDEAIGQSASDYKNFNEFFTRPLKPGRRPLADAQQFIISPADGAISQFGAITDGQIVQAKNHHYSAAELLADADAAEKYAGGEFMTIYLSPRDYHRVHMPFTGRLISARYVPGDLFSVNDTTAENVPNLFARNERLVCRFDTERGEVAVIMVGALIVAGIETPWAGKMTPAEPYAYSIEEGVEPINLAVGDELGRFYLGSTAILLFQPEQIQWLAELNTGDKLQMGQAIAAR